MKRSQLVALIALVALLIIYFAVKSARNVTVAQPKSFVKLDTTKVDGIGIRGKIDTIRLKKEGGIWRLAEPIDYPAEARFVSDLLSKLANLEIETLISEDPAKDSLFQVNQSGTEIAVMAAGDTVANFLLGKTSDDGRHTYARKVRENKIYLVSAVFGGQLNRKAKDWRDKVILEMAKENITRLDFQYPKETLSLVKQDTLWALEEGGQTLPADQRAVDRALSAISRFRTFDYVDGDSAKIVDFSHPDFVITVSTEGGATSRLAFVPQDKEANRYLVRKDGVENTLFVIYKGSANTLMKKAEDFKEKVKQGTSS